MAICLSDRIRAAIPAFLIATAFCFGLFLHSYQDTQHFPALILLSFALCMTCAGRHITVPSSSGVMILLLLCTLTLLSFGLSSVPFASQIALCIFAALPLAFFATSARPAIIRPLSVFAGIIFAALSVWAIAQTLFVPDGPYGTRATGPVLDPNSFATILNIGLISIAGATLASSSLRIRNVLTLLGLLLFAGIVATASRSGLCAALVALSLLLWSQRHVINKIRLSVIAMTGAAIATILPLLSGNGLWPQMGRLLDAAGPENASLGDRLSLWRSSWRMLLDHPWIGTGPGTFSLYYPTYREPFNDQSLGHFTHLDPLQMGVEMGVGGPILFYALLIAVLLRTIRAVGAITEPSQRLAILTPFAALLAVALQAHVNFPLYMMPILLACGVLLAQWHLATVAVLYDGSLSLTFRNIWQNLFARTGGALVLLCLLALSGSAAFGNYYLRIANTAQDPKSFLLALAWAKGMGPESFINPEVEMARLNLHLIDRTDNIKSPHLKNNLLREADQSLNAASAWNPAWAEIDYLRGEMNQIKGNKALMLDAWMIALHKNPMHVAARQDLATALRDAGREGEAVKIVRDGLNFPMDSSYRDWAEIFLKKGPKKDKQIP